MSDEKGGRTLDLSRMKLAAILKQKIDLDRAGRVAVEPAVRFEPLIEPVLDGFDHHHVLEDVVIFTAPMHLVPASHTNYS